MTKIISSASPGGQFMFFGSVVVLQLSESTLQQSQLSLKVVSVTLILSQLEEGETA